LYDAGTVKVCDDAVLLNDDATTTDTPGFEVPQAPTLKSVTVILSVAVTRFPPKTVNVQSTPFWQKITDDCELVETGIPCWGINSFIKGALETAVAALLVTTPETKLTMPTRFV